MKKLSYLLFVGLLLSIPAICQNRYLPKYASSTESKILQDADTLLSKSWLIFKTSVDTATFFSRYAEDLGLRQNPDLKFIKIREDKDQIGMIHSKFQLYYKNVKMEGLEYQLHSKDGKVRQSNGKLISDFSIEIPKKIDLKGLINRYISENLNEKFLVTTIGFEPELVIFRADIEDFNPKNLKLAVKAKFTAYDPFEAYDAYLDPESGRLLKKTSSIIKCFSPLHSHSGNSTSEETLFPIHTLVSPPPTSATFTPTRTRYGTNVSMETWSSGGATQNLEWRFYETQHGSTWEIQHNITKNYQNTTVFNNPGSRNAIYLGWPNITNPNSSWGTNQQSATTAHWSFQTTYKYFRDVHGRQGPGNIGRAGNLLVNVPQNEPTIGMGGPFFWSDFSTGVGGELFVIQSWNNTDLHVLDIIAHEFTHAWTKYTSNLVYEREPGALNESISDIFAYCVERRTLPTTWNWLMGEDIGVNRHFRDMQNPTSIPNEPSIGRSPQPDTYLGPFWQNTVNNPADNYGVHTNSGVMNNMFYLLCAGGTRNGFTINAIPFDRAERIFYLAFGSYMTSNDDYADARAATLLAAQNLYGNCSTEFRMVGRAWGAVGVGTGSGCPNGGRMGVEEISEEVEERTDFQLASNPNNGKFEVLLTLRDENPINLSVIDMQGRQLFLKMVRGTGKHNEIIELTNVASGNYLVVLKSNSGFEVKKIFVVK